MDEMDKLAKRTNAARNGGYWQFHEIGQEEDKDDEEEKEDDGEK